MLCAYPAWKFVADTCLLKMQCAEQHCLRHWKFCRSTSVHNLQVAFKILYISDYKTKLCHWRKWWSDMTIQVTFISDWLGHNIVYTVRYMFHIHFIMLLDGTQ
jgi:hypothetical protein